MPLQLNLDLGGLGIHVHTTHRDYLQVQRAKTGRTKRIAVCNCGKKFTMLTKDPLIMLLGFDKLTNHTLSVG